MVLIIQVKKEKEPEVTNTPKEQETIPVDKPEDSKFPRRKSSKTDEVDRINCSMIHSFV